ncbi:MAG: hypothetical protein M5U34_13905 [Chloroflexi bacterium]|nr:hypothetical protein [Chloroflexota bacterium]
MQNGDKIRAGGHLAFDPHGRTILRVRDVEVVQAQRADRLAMEPIVERSELASVLAGMEEKPETSDDAMVDDLPTWVKELAPPAYQSEQKKGEERRNGRFFQSKW